MEDGGKKEQRMEKSIEQLAQEAKGGDKSALDDLIRRIYGNIYGLALRMLAYSSDAEDATQEILIKIVTHLSTFRGESSFKTWSFHIAVNHLRSIKQSRAARLNISFDMWEQLGHRDDPSFDDASLPDAEKMLLTEEVRIGCMQGMLQCLDGKTRLALILGEIFEMSSDEGACVLAITPTAFRKRLSRGREQLVAHMRKNCSLFNKDNRCRCSNLIGPDIRDGWIDPHNLQFVGPHRRITAVRDIMDRLHELDEIRRAILLFRSYPEVEPPAESIVAIVQKMMDSKAYEILNLS
jgi:RNA polymerase sigma factor (sigma-70 family)